MSTALSCAGDTTTDTALWISDTQKILTFESPDGSSTAYYFDDSGTQDTTLEPGHWDGYGSSLYLDNDIAYMTMSMDDSASDPMLIIVDKDAGLVVSKYIGGRTASRVTCTAMDDNFLATMFMSGSSDSTLGVSTIVLWDVSSLPTLTYLNTEAESWFSNLVWTAMDLDFSAKYMPRCAEYINAS